MNKHQKILDSIVNGFYEDSDFDLILAIASNHSGKKTSFYVCPVGNSVGVSELANSFLSQGADYDALPEHHSLREAKLAFDSLIILAMKYDDKGESVMVGESHLGYGNPFVIRGMVRQFLQTQQLEITKRWSISQMQDESGGEGTQP